MVLLACTGLTFAADMGELSCFPPQWEAYACDFEPTASTLYIRDKYNGAYFKQCIGYASTSEQDYELSANIQYDKLNEYGLCARGTLTDEVAKCYYVAYNGDGGSFNVVKILNGYANPPVLDTDLYNLDISDAGYSATPGETLKVVMAVYDIVEGGVTKTVLEGKVYKADGTLLRHTIAVDDGVSYGGARLTGDLYGTFAYTGQTVEYPIEAHYSAMQINPLSVISGTITKTSVYPDFSSVTINVKQGGSVVESHPITLTGNSTAYSFGTTVTGAVELEVASIASWTVNGPLSLTLVSGSTYSAQDFTFTAPAMAFDGKLTGWPIITSTGGTFNPAPGLHADPADDNTVAMNNGFGDPTNGNLDILNYGAMLTTVGGKQYINFAFEVSNRFPISTYLVTNIPEAFFEVLLDVDQNGGPGTSLGTASALHPNSGGNFYWNEWKAASGSYDTSNGTPVREANAYGLARAFEGADIDIQWAIPYGEISGAGSNGDRGFGFYGCGTLPSWVTWEPLDPTDDLLAFGTRYWGQTSDLATGDQPREVGGTGSGIWTVGPDQGDGKGYVIYNANGYTVEFRVPTEDVVTELGTKGYHDGVEPTTTWDIGLRCNDAFNSTGWVGDNSGNGDPAHASAGIITVSGIELPPQPVQLSGAVTLQSLTAGMEVGKTLTIQVGLTGETLTPVLGAGGTYTATCATTTPGTYDIYFKASHWLRVKLGSVTLVAGSNSLSTPTLLNGDVNGDNAVTSADLGLLKGNYLKTGSGLAGDLNEDGSVTSADLGILKGNYLKSGD
jgi:hypothetical protein